MQYNNNKSPYSGPRMRINWFSVHLFEDEAVKRTRTRVAQVKRTLSLVFSTAGIMVAIRGLSQSFCRLARGASLQIKFSKSRVLKMRSNSSQVSGQVDTNYFILYNDENLYEYKRIWLHLWSYKKINKNKKITLSFSLSICSMFIIFLHFCYVVFYFIFYVLSMYY